MTAISTLIATLNNVADKVRDLLSGEPLRFIAYGAAIVIYVAAKVSGTIPDVTLTEAFGQAVAAAAVVAAVVESARRFVTPVA